ncbi:lysophosphatidic acid receptor 4-like [Synchiropus splendidus]|uniref:lysophosphatidic acid receptor 4-like n=1 Tax=Synchiropus splendidus TaxID=270530 RepID=UPI00237D3433|nr:lysophosphatidic acid receptor 4-like [Synchiropus splendidus]
MRRVMKASVTKKSVLQSQENVLCSNVVHTSSQVLGMNLAVMGLLYTSMLPSSLIFESINPVRYGNETSGFNESNPIFSMKDSFNMLNLIGCPLLLTCMCVERYLAVMHPVLYLRLRKWKNLCIVSAVVWMITFSFCLSAGMWI